MKKIPVFLWIPLFFLISNSLYAHVLKYSSSELKMKDHGADWILKVHIADFDQKFSGMGEEVVKNYLPTRLNLSRGGEPCRLEKIDLQVDRPNETVTIPLQYFCPKTDPDVQITYDLFYADLNHKHLLKLNLEGKTFSRSFSPEENSAEFSARDNLWQTFKSFILLGLEHILTGYDHILFVLSLVLGARRFKMLFWLVTSFTLAHSISLALAALGIFTLSPKFVEPAIAASIAFVAIRHSVAREDQDFRGDVFITFFFGLIHGLGFSSALQEANLQKGNIVVPLLSFNSGVELGQVMIVSAVFPLLKGLEKVLKGSYLYLRRGLLLAIAGVGLYWVVERIWF
ncbi:MAG: HupE/UreJ family protein [bacterium]